MRNTSGILKESLYDEEMPEKVYRKGFPSKVYEGNLLLNQREKIGHGSFGNVYKCPYVEDG
uniref:Uncharacterized protein n=1 Tax=Panagrolaimus sp. ES5 TaxID=591445 RepID=A0AC34FB07_9BILA